jgi:hypothetical protein
MKRTGNCILHAFLAILLISPVAHGSTIIVSDAGPGFPLSEKGRSAPMYVSSSDFPGVIRAFTDLQSDIGKVTNVRPELFTGELPAARYAVIAGTIGKSPVIDELIKSGKLNAKDIEGKWESFIIRVIEKPVKGIKEAIVIAGSDKRGTIYGIYEISTAIGVSPWYWWADVPVEHRNDLYVSRATIVSGPPAIKYRGIFLNDEYPDLTNWINAKYGTVKPSENPPVPAGVANYNHEFYTKLFELILRLKGNYLWPAMWNNAFNEDDPENPRLADEYGIVMGTSHQEPMLRAQKEWDRRYLKTLGSWNYAKYSDLLQDFWREGIRRNKNYESIITMGLRGADDTEMAPGGPAANMKLLEEIVGVQRKIISEEVNPDVTRVPQMWCLYKEVLEYYRAGMRVPEDVTLLWAEDNWGNVRRVPSAEERKRSGGAGIYYHFDYHGGPRSYQWLNTNPLPKIWDQLTFARQFGADRIWIVNVGHFKAYSLPLQYFMDLAWYGDSLKHDNVNEYLHKWSVQQFGNNFADETAEILTQYTRYNGRRKPELLSPSTYSLTDYREAETVVSDFNRIAVQAEAIYNNLPAEKRDAFYQLVLFPTKASALVNELYLAAGRNELYARQRRASTNSWATEVQSLFEADTALMGYFNRDFVNGKWNHFMDQPHLGYISWRDPPVNNLRHLSLQTINVPQNADMAVSVEGSEEAWPGSADSASLPEFDVYNRQERYFEIFNRGKEPFRFSLSSDPWIRLSEDSGKVDTDLRIRVNVDWDKVSEGKNHGSISISGNGKTIEIGITAFNPSFPPADSVNGFVESNGYVSMEAAHYSTKTALGENQWLEVQDYGHTFSGMRATMETSLPRLQPGINAPCLEYRMYLFTAGTAEVIAWLAPTLNFLPGRPVRYAISVDDEEPRMITVLPEDFDARNGNREWEQTVSDNYRIVRSTHNTGTAGSHTLKIWMVDPGVLFQKIVVNMGGVKSSYLGPPESFSGIAR